jgi:uncharacterized protein involved in response to NO
MSSQLLTLGRDAPRAPGPAILASGFRPFFLLAALYAAVGIPFWVATLAAVPPWRVPANPLDWHAHEMVFGYAGAVLAGFLLTAIRKWTGQPTADGLPLLVLCALWTGARILPFLPVVPTLVAASVDVGFWVGLFTACARPILRARNRRNYGFILLLAAFVLAAMISHANRLGYVHGDFWGAHSLGVDLVALAIVVMAGRVVPSFTRNATRGTDISETPGHDRFAVVCLALVTALDAASLSPRWSAVPAGVAGIVVLARARHWGPKYTLREPLLWSLHLAHAWLGFGLVLRGLVPWVAALPPSIALHAITAGGIGLVTFSMMTRVTLGHTGRMLHVPPRVGVLLGLLATSGLIRVVGPIVAASRLSVVLAVAGALWSASFAGYLLVYGRALVTPRLDGLPG